MIPFNTVHLVIGKRRRDYNSIREALTSVESRIKCGRVIYLVDDFVMEFLRVLFMLE